MKRLMRKWFVLLATMCISTLVCRADVLDMASGEGPNAREDGTYYGIFVGINEYSTSASTLSGCVNDAYNMYDAWTKSGSGYCNAANAYIYTNYGATKSAIRSRMRELANAARSGDTVLYFHSSHGGNDYYYSYDAYLCTTDDYYEDYEFAEDLTQFATGVKVIVVLDACHSGGMFKRTGGAQSKGKWNFVENVQRLLENAHKGSAGGTTKGSPSVGWISAADYDESSSDGSYYGSGYSYTGTGGDFTVAFLDGWTREWAETNGDGNLDFWELFEYARDNCWASNAQYLNQSVLQSVVAGRTVTGGALADALDNLLTFTTGGDASWYAQTSQTHDGVGAATSGTVDNGESSWLQTTVSGMGTISFWWNVSSESGYDFLEFLVDGTVVDSISGTSGSWAQVTYQISSSGPHTIQWRYRKDYSVSSGLDAGFVDQVTWTPASSATYTVTLYMNDGTGTSRQYSSVPAGDWTIPTLSTLSWSRSGYTFLGWSTSSTATSAMYSNGQRITISGSVTLYAVWRPTYTVTLYRNDGTGTRRQYSSVSAGDWTIPTLSTLSWSRSGYAFLGWSTSTPATSAMYSNGQRITVSGPTTLYAVWRPTMLTALDNSSLTFTTGGSASWYGQTSWTHDGVDAVRSGAVDHGESSWLQTTVSGTGTVSFWWNVSSESGYDFLELLVDGTVVDSISGTGGSWTQKAYTISSAGSHTIRWRYRKDHSVSSGLDAGFVDQVTWTPTVKYTVTFNANGGSGSMAAQQFTQGVSQRLTANAFWRTGYTFAGWSTSPGGSVAYSDGQSVRMAANRTLYASWREIVAGWADSYFPRAQKSDGVLYRGNALVGTVQVKFGKVSSKNTVKVSATATMVVNGKIKKLMARAVNVNLGSMRAILTFRDPIGNLLFEMQDDGTYTLRSASYFMAAASIGGAQSRARTFKLGSFGLAVPGELQTALLPYNVAFSESGGKWQFARAASVRVTKNQVAQVAGIRHEADVVVVDDSAGKTNLSALKLMYTAKTGQFKGSFKAYALVEDNGRRKLVKYTISVAGFVVNGTGYGEAACQRPVGGPWSVTVE